MAFITDIVPDTEGPNSQSDQELIAAYRRSSDLKILAQLYQRYLTQLYGVCLKYLGEPESAKDAVMDIFEQLIRKLPKHEVNYFRGWIYAIAKNHCLMQLRSANRVKIDGFDPDHMQTADELHLKDRIEKEEQFQRLSKCIEALAAEQQTVIRLFYLENKCYKEIETATGMEWNKVRSHIQNGRRNLKICMQKQDKVVSNE